MTPRAPFARPAFRALAGLAVLAALAASQPAAAQRELTKIPNPDPELERRSFEVAEGFEVNLYAADPLLAKPIQMNFDPAGRLWVACSEVYPQIRPGQTANDRILVLEDRDGDGRAERATVFADGLLIPTGIEPGDGGAYVANSTDLIHLADTDGDGKADRRRVVLSGFGTEDTHHILHTLRWGPDGMLYFNQSIYIHSHIETPHGVRRLDGGGIWQLRPETLGLEVFARGWVNSWGHHFDRWGQSFATDGAYGEGINVVVPGASYITAVGAARILSGLNPGSPKHCGLEVVSGRHLPEAWRGNLLTNDFRGHRVCRFILREEGSSYVSQEMPELIKTNHAAFRPVDVKMGPDGAIYIADWYNPIIQHGEVDFRDPRRDHTHGRIWRVTAKGRPLVPRPQLVGASTADLLAALKAPEDWTRHQAKRVLKERGAAVLPDLAAWVARLDPVEPECEHHRLEALWTYQALDVPEPGLLEKLLHARDHRVRAAATRVAGYWQARLAGPLELLAACVTDEPPRVRLEAVRALARVPDPQAVSLALRTLDRPMDGSLDYALWLTLREQAPRWLQALELGSLDLGGGVDRLLFALRAVGSAAAAKPLAGLIRSGTLAADHEAGALTALASMGGPEELALVFKRALGGELPGPHVRTSLLAALEQAARQRGVRPAAGLARIGSLLGEGEEASRAAAARLIGLWKVEGLRPELVQLARTDKTGEALRRAAIEALAQLGGAESRAALESLCRQDQPPAVRSRAVIALAALDPGAAARPAVEVLTQPGGNPALIFAAFVQRKDGVGPLTAALAGHKLSADVAKLGVRAVRASGREHPALVDVLNKAGGLATGPRVFSWEEVGQLVAAGAGHGDPARGEAVYRRKDLQCMKCHAIAGAGGQVGPDLVSIGASAPVDYLIESILQPNKAVKENYHSLVVTTAEGKVVTGIKIRQTDRDLVLRDAEDREVSVPLRSVEETAVGASLMPDGLADGLTRAELVDLVRFLSELGKVGPYAVSKARLVRDWQVLEATPAARSLLQSTRFARVTGDDPSLTWSPAYSTVAGLLPLEAVPGLEFRKWMRDEADTFGFVRCRLETAHAARVRLRLNTTTGITVWVDGAPVEVKDETPLGLSAGTHTLAFVIDLGRRHEGLRCEIADEPGAAASVQVRPSK
jgi:putative heme-binding domain-containing protein